MSFFLMMFLVGILFTGYVFLGFILGATLCKRSSASWRLWGSNLGEFIMSMSPVGLAVFSIFWPLQLMIGIILVTVDRVRHPQKYLPLFRRQRKHPSTNTLSLFSDVEINSAYPTQVKNFTPSKSKFTDNIDIEKRE